MCAGVSEVALEGEVQEFAVRRRRGRRREVGEDELAGRAHDAGERFGRVPEVIVGGDRDGVVLRRLQAADVEAHRARGHVEPRVRLERAGDGLRGVASEVGHLIRRERHGVAGLVADLDLVVVHELIVLRLIEAQREGLLCDVARGHGSGTPPRCDRAALIRGVREAALALGRVDDPGHADPPLMGDIEAADDRAPVGEHRHEVRALLRDPGGGIALVAAEVAAADEVSGDILVDVVHRRVLVDREVPLEDARLRVR